MSPSTSLPMLVTSKKKFTYNKYNNSTYDKGTIYLYNYYCKICKLALYSTLYYK